MKVSFNLIIVMFLFAGCSSVSSDLPIDKWRKPLDSDITGDWKIYAKEVEKPYYAEGDFDGDGKTDEAWILFSKSDENWGLFVFLGNKKVIKLDSGDAKTKAQMMGIETISPSQFREDCKVRNDNICSTNRIKNTSIDYFMYESASSIFYWNPSVNKFERAWRGD